MDHPAESPRKAQEMGMFGHAARCPAAAGGEYRGRECRWLSRQKADQQYPRRTPCKRQICDHTYHYVVQLQGDGWMMRVLVTGGAAGIGLAIAQKCAREGAEVYVCDVSAEQLHDCLAANPGLYGSVADISEPKDAQAAVREAEALLGGGLDLLVNNAGIAGPKAPVQDIPVEE